MCVTGQPRSGDHERRTLLLWYSRACQESLRLSRRKFVTRKFFEDFPLVGRERAIAVLEAARERLSVDAPAA